MLKYFELLLELLRPEDDNFVVEGKKQLLSTAQKLEERWDKNLKIHHRYRFIFDAYDDLIHGKISLDEFLTTWDITSNKNLNKNSESSIPVINSIIDGVLKNADNTLFILDTISFWSLSDKDKKAVQSWTKDHNCELVFC